MALSFPVLPSPVPQEDDTAELLRRQVTVQSQLLKYAKECGIAFYRPHYYQHLYHTSSAKRRGLFAGNRFGKSKGDAAETVAWMLGERPWYKTSFDVLGVEHDEGRNRHVVVKSHHSGSENHPFVRQNIPAWPSKQLITCTNWDKVHEIWTSQDSDRPGKMWELLPKGFATFSKNHEGVIDEIHGSNGSLTKFVGVDGFKRNPQVVESSDWDRIGIDEPAPQPMWKGAARGLVDRNGQGDFTLTSLTEMWIYDYFYSEETKENKDREAWRATIYDNPFNTDEAIQRYALELTDDEKTCRLLGLPLELAGLVYKEYHREQHVLKEVPKGWRDFHLPPKSHILYIRVDPHSVTPNAVLFAAVGPSEIPVICHEIWNPCDADTLADEINEYVRLTGCYVANVKVDPLAWVQDGVTRIASIAKTLSSKGLFIGKASKDFTSGILKTRSAFKQNRLLFSPNCRRTLWELARYIYNQETGKPVDKDDHMMENLRRLCIDNLPFFDPDKAQGHAINDQEFVEADLTTNY